MNSAAIARRALIEFLRVMPRTALSRLGGAFASLRLPGRLQRYEIESFARFTGIDLSDVEVPIHAFSSLQEFFVRPLRRNARPIDAGVDSVVAPCDGKWGSAGTVEAGRLCQIKGRTYTLASLIGDADRAASFEGGTYATFYLAPYDYHRFHTPCPLRFVAARSVAGSLWPVNRAGLEGVENLFARNERIVAYAIPQRAADNAEGGAAVAGGSDTESTGSHLCMVAVGAVMVGRVRVLFDDSMTTNRGSDRDTTRSYDPGMSFAKGAEWGRFELGSTIVLIAPPGMLELEVEEPGTPLRLGQRIGTLL